MLTQKEQIALLNRLLRRDAMVLAVGGRPSAMRRCMRRAKLLSRLTATPVLAIVREVAATAR